VADFGEFHPRQEPPMTAAKKEMIVASKSELEWWVHQAQEDLSSVLSQAYNKGARDLFTSAELTEMFNLQTKNFKKAHENTMSAALRNAGFRKFRNNLPVNVDGKSEKFWIMRYRAKWEKCEPRDVAKHVLEQRAKEKGKLT
jgi:hypothetical protein